MRAIGQAVRVGGAIVAVAAVNVAGAGLAGLGSAATIQGPASGTITTVVGGPGGPGPARQVAISVCGPNSSCPLTFAGGQLYFPDENHVVRAVSIAAGRLTTPAGNGIDWYGGDGSPATGAEFFQPSAAAVDQAGDLLVADLQSSRVRIVAARSGTFFGQSMTAGDIYDLAGAFSNGGAGDGGLGTSTLIAPPDALAFDHAGNALIGCLGAGKKAAQIRVVAAATGTFYGQAMTVGHIYTIAGDRTGTVVSGNGGPATKAGLGVFVGSFQVDQHGNVVIADSSANQIRVVAGTSGRFYGRAMTAGDIYAIAGKGVAGFSGDGGLATAAALSFPTGVALDGAGNLVVADQRNNRVRVVAVRFGTFYGRVMLARRIYTIAGGGTRTAAGSPALAASLHHPAGVTVDSAGNVVFAQSHGSRIWAVASQTGTFYGVTMTSGHFYPIAGTGLANFSGNGRSLATTELADPTGVAVDHAGDIFISDTGHDRVRVAPGHSGQLFGRWLRAGRIYTLAGTGVSGTAGNGGPATSAELLRPGRLVVDHAGNLLFADGNLRLEVVAATSGTFYGQHMIAGHLYMIAGALTGRLTIGVPALNDYLGDLAGLAVAPDGSIVLADTSFALVLIIPATTGTFFDQQMTAGDLYIIAGDGDMYYSGDGALATRSAVWPGGVAVDSAGNVLVADSFNNRVRVVPAATGTFYGQTMKDARFYSIVVPNGTQLPDVGTAVMLDRAGNVIFADSITVQMLAVTSGTFYGQAVQSGNLYLIAGAGSINDPESGADGLGDGGPAAKAVFDFAQDLAAGPGNDLYVADNEDNRVRQITP